MAGIFKSLRKEIIKHKPCWLYDVMPYLHIIAAFGMLYLIYKAKLI